MCTLKVLDPLKICLAPGAERTRLYVEMQRALIFNLTFLFQVSGCYNCIQCKRGADRYIAYIDLYSVM